MAVVIVRVKPRMLPPTSITAPTSEMVRPKPARTAVKSSGANDHKDLRNGLHSCRSVADQFVAIARPGSLAGAMHQRGDDRNGEQGLSDDHGGRREQQVEKAQRPRTREREIQTEPDNDRRQPEECVDENNDGSPPWEWIERKRRTQGKADGDGCQSCGHADPKGKPDNSGKFVQRLCHPSYRNISEPDFETAVSLSSCHASQNTSTAVRLDPSISSQDW